MKNTKTSGKRWLLGGLAAVIVVVGAAYGARELAWPALKSWRVDRMNRDARAFLVAGDPANALLTARKSLQSTNRNPAAWRIAVEASAARDRPDALWYQENLCREEPTLENRLELLRLALRFNLPGNAIGMIETMAEDARDIPEFHRLAAQIDTRTGRAAEAGQHLAALARLQPDDPATRLDLAAQELAADPERKNSALRARILTLAEHADLRSRALALLLRENVSAQLVPGTADLVLRLRLEPATDFPTRLLIIEALFLLEDPEAVDLLAQLQRESGEHPADAARVVALLRRTRRPAEAGPWLATLPAATRADEDVQRETAECLLKLGDASGLEALLRGGRWAKREYLREALLAYAYRAQDRPADFTEAWRLALISAGSDLGRATTLLARADEWRWGVERHDVIWKLFGLVPENESVQQSLISWERYRGNTTNLHRLFTRIAEVRPDDENARNNLAYLGLLLDANNARSGLLSAALATRYPDNPYYVTTHALALRKQGLPGEALALLDALPATDRAEPMRMLIRAVCLADLGQAGPASDLLDGVVLDDLLPEERRLADTARTEIARLDRTHNNHARLVALRDGASPAPAAAAGWLALVSTETRGAAGTELQLADTLYAASDWDALRDLLTKNTWSQDNHLRSALLAFVLRQQGSGRESLEAWRQALALANRDIPRLRDLRALASGWRWAPERLETLNLIFERDVGDRALLAELLAYYRETRRTPDLLRVLGLHLADHAGQTDEAVAYAYYSLLLDTHVARAEVTARSAFEAAPTDDVRRLVQGFSLWKQNRTAEALLLLPESEPTPATALVPASLLRAAILAGLGEADAARVSLAGFDPAQALPEEAALAERLARQLSALRPPQT